MIFHFQNNKDLRVVDTPGQMFHGMVMKIADGINLVLIQCFFSLIDLEESTLKKKVPTGQYLNLNTLNGYTSNRK